MKRSSISSLVVVEVGVTGAATRVRSVVNKLKNEEEGEIGHGELCAVVPVDEAHDLLKVLAIR
jgi:hypothetical protein